MMKSIDSTTKYGECDDGKEFDPSVFQYAPDTCAIQSQKLVLEKYGIHCEREELIDEAKLHGWYVEGQGTPIGDVGKLLELHGVPVEVSDGNNVFSLANELANHRQIIVAVDGDELWDKMGVAGDMEDMIVGESANHALIVAGLDTSDPENVKVILTDPGTGGLRVEYSEDEFMRAWSDSNCYMVSTEIAPEEMAGLPYEPESEFAGVPTEDIAMLGNADFFGGDIDDYAIILRDVSTAAVSVAVAVRSLKHLVENWDTDTQDVVAANNPDIFENSAASDTDELSGVDVNEIDLDEDLYSGLDS